MLSDGEWNEIGIVGLMLFMVLIHIIIIVLVGMFIATMLFTGIWWWVFLIAFLYFTLCLVAQVIKRREDDVFQE